MIERIKEGFFVICGFLVIASPVVLFIVGIVLSMTNNNLSDTDRSNSEYDPGNNDLVDKMWERKMEEKEKKEKSDSKGIY